MAFGNGKSKKNYDDQENTLIGAGWEMEKNGVVFTGTINLTTLKALVAAHPDAVETYKESKQVRIFGFVPKAGKKGKGPDFYIKFSGAQDAPKVEQEEAPF